MGRLKKEAEKRFGFTGTAGTTIRWFPNSRHYRRVLLNVRFKHNNKLFREHVWIPVKYLKNYEDGDVVYLTAEINAYNSKDRTKAELIKIKIKENE